MTKKTGSFSWKCGMILFLWMFLWMFLAVSVVEAAVVSEGAFRGTFIGDSFGSFSLTVDRDGYISGELFFNKSSVSVPLKGRCTVEGACEFADSDGTMVFRGQVDQFNRFIGRWLASGGEKRGSFYGMKQ